MKFSIIVPVYNVEKYIRKCLDSILSQTYSNWECIVIDDGTPDQSGDICDEYAVLDKRFRVIHKDNEGVSSARNVGLEYAEGEWVLFVDADDMLEFNSLSIIASSDLTYDYIRFGRKEVFANGLVKYYKQEMDFDINTYCSYLIKQMTFSCIWEGVYKNAVIKANNVRFEEKIRIGEDWMFICRYLLGCNSYNTLPDCLYIYNRGNEISCLHLRSIDKNLDLLRGISIIEAEYAKACDKYEECFAFGRHRVLSFIIKDCLSKYLLWSKAKNEVGQLKEYIDSVHFKDLLSPMYNKMCIIRILLVKNDCTAFCYWILFLFQNLYWIGTNKLKKIF